MTTHKSLDVYLQFKREEAWKTRLSLFSRILSLLFLGTFLYLLFQAHYTASPVLVWFNYLALYTGISTLVHFKVFEIPQVLLDLEQGKEDFFLLSQTHRVEILEKTLKEAGVFPVPLDLETWTRERIFVSLPIQNRFPWKRIGKLYFIKYFLVTGIGVIALFYQMGWLSRA